MLKKPAGYDEAKTFDGEYSRLEVGGHKLVITDAEVVEGANWQAIEITFETTRDDIQPNFYANKRDELGDPDAWVGDNHRLFVPFGDPGSDMYKRNNSNLKSFITSLEESNQGFTYNWNKDVGQIVGKRIGGVFGEEEYLSTKGDIRTSVKLRWFRSIDGALKAPIPKLKELRDKPVTTSASIDDGDAAMPLPFDL